LFDNTVSSYSRRGASNLKGSVPVNRSMNEVLSDTSLFEDHFCSPTTVKNLRGVPTQVLQKVLLELHQHTACNIFASPRLWTPAGSEQCVVVAGSLGIDGRTRGKRVGLCVDRKAYDKVSPSAIYLWANTECVDQITADGAVSHDFEKMWVSWRSLSETGPAKYLRLLMPVARKSNSGWEVSFDSDRGELIAFLTALRDRYEPKPATLKALSSTLKLFGHSNEAITPAVIDNYRHADEDAPDTDAEFDQQKPISIVRNLSRSKPALRERAQPTDADTDDTSKVIIRRFEAHTLFSALPKVPPAPSLSFMDTAFSCRNLDAEPFQAAGLYGIFFKASAEQAPSLIYVGLYRNGQVGSGPVFGGNVLRDRWVKHIATCSMRGANVGIGKRTAQRMRLDPDHDFAALGQPNVAELIVKDTGFNAGENRALFAKGQWSVLRDATGEDILQLFSFSYVRLSAFHGTESDDQIRRRVSAAEDRVKIDLAPICNGETLLGQHRTDVTPEQFEVSATFALSG